MKIGTDPINKSIFEYDKQMKRVYHLSLNGRVNQGTIVMFKNFILTGHYAARIEFDMPTIDLIIEEEKQNADGGTK